MKYWNDRIAAASFKATAGNVDKALAALYRETAAQLVDDIIALYNEVQKKDVILPNDIYRNNRYYDLLNKMNKSLVSLGSNEIKVNEKHLLKMYAATRSAVAADIRFTLPTGTGEDIINKIWCADGNSWSDRVWKNKNLMRQNLEDGLMQCIQRGLPKDKVVGEMRGLVNQDFNKADRLIRTELTFVQNETAASTYSEAGVEEYQYVAEVDDRTSEECAALDGQIFRLDERQIGVNFPPLHPNCRCTVVPIVKF